MTQVTVDHALQIAIGHHSAGRLAEAEAIYRQILARVPDHCDALHLLGASACQAGRTDAAIDLIGRAIAIKPTVADYHSNLGESYRRAGRWEEAIASLRRAIALRPDHAEAHNNLGIVLKGAGRLDEAIAAYGKAIALRPDCVEAHNNLGNTFWSAGRLDEAIASCRRAIALRPDWAEAYNSLGNALRSKGRLDEAIAAFGRAIALRPELAEAHNNLGNALKDEGRLDEAVAAYRRAVEIEPHYAEAHSNLGNVFKDQGALDEALACFRRAVALKPDFSQAASNLVCTLHYHPDIDAAAILREHRNWAARYAEPLAAEARPHANDRAPDRRLRVGFVSPDLRDHPVGLSLLTLLTHLDRREFEVVCYSDVRAADRVTEQLRTLADLWRDVAGVGDASLAERVRGDGVDILVDLALHTAGNRMLVFARKPAPVQATMLGMPATTGLSAIDYRLTDPYLDPPGLGDADYAERSIRLPHSFWCYRPPEETPPVGVLPALANGFVTFGCLNNFAKVTRPALALWSEVLRAVPGSRLVIQSPPGGHREAVRVLFQGGGIASDRVVFAPKVPQAHYFALYHDVDVSLDPFPYNGHTSALDSLWMGVPVVTLSGRTAAGRGGVSILSNLGLTELIAGDPREYVEIAAGLAGDLARLAALRAGLRERLRGSSLMDGERYAADVGSAFRRMWGAWCGR